MNSHSPHGRHFGGIKSALKSNDFLLAIHSPFWRASKLFQLNHNGIAPVWRANGAIIKTVINQLIYSRQIGEILARKRK
jgi:hypothetical protein